MIDIIINTNILETLVERWLNFDSWSINSSTGFLLRSDFWENLKFGNSSFPLTFFESVKPNFNLFFKQEPGWEYCFLEPRETPCSTQESGFCMKPVKSNLSNNFLNCFNAKLSAKQKLNHQENHYTRKVIYRSQHTLNAETT